MKKKILFIIALCLFVLVGCEKQYTTYNEVTLDELKKMVEAKESFVLVVGSESCSACATYKPTMEKVIQKYNVKINYINVALLSTEEIAALELIVHYNSTPTTAFFEKGEITGTHDTIIGAAGYKEIVEALTRKGYIG